MSIKTGISQLEEFRFLFHDEAGVGSGVAKLGLREDSGEHGKPLARIIPKLSRIALRL